MEPDTRAVLIESAQNGAIPLPDRRSRHLDCKRRTARDLELSD